MCVRSAQSTRLVLFGQRACPGCPIRGKDGASLKEVRTIASMRRIAALGLIPLTVLAIDVLIKARVEQWLAPFQQVALIGDGIRLTRAYEYRRCLWAASGGQRVLAAADGRARGRASRLDRGHCAPSSAGIPRTVGARPAARRGGGELRRPDARRPRATDYLDIGWGAWRWPTFNLADCAIVLGVLLLLMISLRQQPPVLTGES